MSKTIKIFIAYSHKDRASLDEFRTHAAPLVRNQQIQIWYDGEIRPGEVWNNSIKKNLHAADIILLLLSASSLASDYFYTQEVQDSLDRHYANTSRVVPIILSSCLWEETPLANLQGLPKGMKPIYDWANVDSAWNNVVQGVREIIQEMERAGSEQINSSKLSEPQRDEKTKNIESPATNQKSKMPSAADSHAWEFTIDMDKRTAYEKYLTRFPDGYYVEEAKAKLDSFIADDIAWEFVVEASTEKAFQKYLEKYPNGTHSLKASEELISLQKKQPPPPPPTSTSYKPKSKKQSNHHCSFCGRNEKEVMILVSGMEAQICDVCSKKAEEIIDQELKAAGVNRE